MGRQGPHHLGRNTRHRLPCGRVYRGLPNEAVEELEDRHLIRPEWRAGARWYELTHDRLIEPIRASNARSRARVARRRLRLAMTGVGGSPAVAVIIPVWVFAPSTNPVPAVGATAKLELSILPEPTPNTLSGSSCPIPLFCLPRN